MEGSKTPLPVETRGTTLEATERTRLKRHRERGHYERAVIDAILDEALVCHVGVNVEGTPRVMPTAHVRVGDFVYVHGARANRFLQALCGGETACITVTLLDGLVFARSAFHHSMNFRSVVLYGCATEVTEVSEKREALGALVEQLAPGRSGETRAPSDAELASTLVAKLPIGEASAKIRRGPPSDAPEDVDSQVWAGELPLSTVSATPRGDAHVDATVEVAPSVATRARELAALAGGASADRDAYLCERGEYVVSCDPSRVDFAVVHRFLAEDSYWARGVAPDVQQRAMRSSLGFGLYRGTAQVGFARVVTDFGRFAYLADVFVVEEARGRGLGTWLLDCVFEHPELREVQQFLLGTADAHRLYERYGFEVTPVGRYMVRRQATRTS